MTTRIPFNTAEDWIVSALYVSNEHTLTRDAIVTSLPHISPVTIADAIECLVMDRLLLRVADQPVVNESGFLTGWRHGVGYALSLNGMHRGKACTDPMDARSYNQLAATVAQNAKAA